MKKTSLLAGLALVLCPLFATLAQDAPDGSEHSLTVKEDYKDEDVAFGSKTVAYRLIRRAVDDALDGCPPGTPARLSLQQMYFVSPEQDHSVLNAGMLVGPASAVALDADGQPNGIERIYEKGVLAQTTPWKHGKKVGDETIYANKVVKATIPWVDGKIEGVRKTFHPDGTLMAETTYVAGEASGPSRALDEQGHVVQEVTMKHNKRDGVSTDFWPDTGKPKREIHYEMGRVEGLTKEYYASGVLKREIPFKNNAMNGLETDYDGDGKVSEKHYWLDGDPVTQGEFEKKSAK